MVAEIEIKLKYYATLDNYSFKHYWNAFVHVSSGTFNKPTFSLPANSLNEILNSL